VAAGGSVEPFLVPGSPTGERDVTDDEVQQLPPGTELRDPHTGERLHLDRHTDLDDGWWLTDGSWRRWHHVPEYLPTGS
jgi:hypothetical protein